MSDLSEQFGKLLLARVRAIGPALDLDTMARAGWAIGMKPRLIGFQKEGCMRRREDEFAAKQKALIKAARELLEPAPVKLHHFPLWMRQAMTRVAKSLGVTFERSAMEPTHRLEQLLFALMPADVQFKDARIDHWGSYRDDDHDGFVSEPYGMTSTALAAWEKFADLAGIESRLSPNSHWFPGSTIRIALYQKRGAK